MHLHHEGFMIGVQCQLMTLEDTLEHLMVYFKFFYGWQFYGKIDIKVKFALLSLFLAELERVINGLGGQKSCQLSI